MEIISNLKQFYIKKVLFDSKNNIICINLYYIKKRFGLYKIAINYL